MTCQDDATFIGPVTLFCGVETAHWNDSQFTAVAQFAKQHGISSLLIKVSEVGSGAGDLWYGGLSGIDHIKSLIEAQGIKFIPYTFPVGPYIDLVTNIQKATDIAVQLLNRYGVVCLDVEGAPWEGQPGLDAGNYMASKLASVPGKLWLSMPADYANNNQNGAMQALSPATNVWMPMSYNDKLTGLYKQQIQQINSDACIQPTLDLSQEFGANNVLANAQKIKADGCLAVSLWYEGFATQNTALVNEIVQLFGGSVSVTPPTTGEQALKTNSDGTIAIAPFWYQLSENEMDTCGPTSCSMVVHTVAPGRQLTATAETIDQDTDAIIKDVFGISDPKQFGGVGGWNTDMYKILIYLRDKYNNFHFVIVSTMEQLEAAVHSGYPCVFGCNEADVTAWNKGKNAWEHAYTWQLSAGHIPGVLVGIESNTGNWLVTDPLNNKFQGYGPPYIYKRSDIAKSFTGGAIIQLTDWLKPIPDINNWPANFNAQNFGGTQPVTQTTNANERKAFENEVQAVIKTGLNLNSGIMSAVWTAYQASKFYGPALTNEYSSVDWSGNEIIVQNFAGCRVEWHSGNGRIFPYS